MDKVNMCQIQKQIDNSKEEMMGVISFILAIFPLSFVINSYLVAMKNIGENQGTENIRTVFFYVLIFLIIGLMFIIMYILTSGMLLSAVNNLKDSEDEELHLIMVDNHIPAGAKLY